MTAPDTSLATVHYALRGDDTELCSFDLTLHADVALTGREPGVTITIDRQRHRAELARALTDAANALLDENAAHVAHAAVPGFDS